MNIHASTNQWSTQRPGQPFSALEEDPDGMTARRGNPRLMAHLRTRLGAWPPVGGFQIVAWPGHDEPGWDGGTLPGQGIESPEGTVLSLSPTLVGDVRSLDQERVAAALRSPDAAVAVPAALGRPDLRLGRAVFRWADHAARLPEIGEWADPGDPRVPTWLRPFNGGVLIAWNAGGCYAAGVGIKRHDRYGQELAAATEPAHRGRGLARMLVAQAARRVLDQGAVPLYLHESTNLASAQVADAAGFPDLGWRVVSLFPAQIFVS